MPNTQVLATLLDGTVLSDEEREYYEMLEARENEPQSYDEAIGLDAYDTLSDR